LQGAGGLALREEARGEVRGREIKPMTDKTETIKDYELYKSKRTTYARWGKKPYTKKPRARQGLSFPARGDVDRQKHRARNREKERPPNFAGERGGGAAPTIKVHLCQINGGGTWYAEKGNYPVTQYHRSSPDFPEVSLPRESPNQLLRRASDRALVLAWPSIPLTN